MLGIVLCGGQSLRMGNDKGLLEYRGERWSGVALRKLITLGIPTMISVNGLQKPFYQTLFGNQNCVVDNILLDVRGPLIGVLSAHEVNPEEDLFVLACDMLLMSENCLQELYDAYLKNQEYEAFIYSNNGFLEPLCGIYTSKGLKKIKTALDGGLLSSHSMKSVLSTLVVYEIQLTKNQTPYFKNFNDTRALNGFQE